MSRLQSFLRRHRRVGLDTNIFIYHVEANPLYVDSTMDVFSWLTLAGNSAVASTLTFTEVLVQPYREGNADLRRAYLGLLPQFPHLDWIAPDLGIADEAARLRAAYRLRTPDAIHLATALRGGATGFLSNDAALARVQDLEVAVLDDTATVQ